MTKRATQVFTENGKFIENKIDGATLEFLFWKKKYEDSAIFPYDKKSFATGDYF